MKPETDDARKGYWLPEEYTLYLTGYDLGALMAILHSYTSPHGEFDGEVTEPGPNGEIVPTTFRARLIRKCLDAVEKCQNEQP